MAKSRRSNNSNKISILNTKLEITEALTTNQEIFLSNIKKSINNEGSTDDILIGCPGTGKTRLALNKAFMIMQEKENINRIVIFRSAEVSQKVGFLPGSLEEKTIPYENGIASIINDIFKRDDAYKILKAHNYIKFRLPVHIRSETLDNSVIIIDEIQNLDEAQLETIYTRSGKNSYIIFCGDYVQSDLERNKQNGVIEFLKTLYRMKLNGNFYIFGPDDIVRHTKLVDYIKTKYGEEYHSIYENFREKALTK